MKLMEKNKQLLIAGFVLWAVICLALVYGLIVNFYQQSDTTIEGRLEAISLQLYDYKLKLQDNPTTGELIEIMEGLNQIEDELDNIERELGGVGKEEILIVNESNPKECRCYCVEATIGGTEVK